jgi:aryl-alcohol dehydrogenase-like predicted oxidoreductase
MGMSWAYGDADRDDATSRQVVNRALDLGVTFIDTASVYGVGDNERLVGSALAGRRDEAFLATKTGLRSDYETRRIRRDASPEWVRADVTGSLERLGVDVIDLLYLHRIDPATPLEETWGALAEFVTEGKVRYLGLSEVGVAELDRAQAIHPVTAVQSELSLWTRDPLGSVPLATGNPAGVGGGGGGNVVQWCADNGAAFVPFSPLGRGYLTGTISASSEFEATDLRASNPRFSAEARAENERLVEVVRRVAERLGARPGQVAIAWTLAQGEHVIPIPGTKRVAYLEENAGAAAIDLDAAALTELTELPAASGSRY